MKYQGNKLVIRAAIGIVAMFLLALFVPSLQNIAKLEALLIYGMVNYVQIKDMKRNGQDIKKPVLFTVAVLIIIGYLLFFI